jgi:hypothetical protein
VRDIAQLVDELAEKNKVTLLWQNADGKIFNPHQARNMLHIILIALESLPRGGCISIGCDEMISFTITGEKVIFTEEKIAYLNKSQQIPAEPRLIGFILLHMMKANIQCDRGKDCLIIKLC